MAFNSNNFDLTNWYLTIPEDENGSNDGLAKNIFNLEDYEHSDYFYDAGNGAMVFRAVHDGATTGSSTYARSEFRELDGVRDNGKPNYASWSAEDGGVMTATLSVDEMPTRHDGKDGRIIIGQVHSGGDELVKVYYSGGKLYYRNEHAGDDDKEYTFNLLNADGEEPNVDLGEKFSYKIDVSDGLLKISVLADGQTYSSVSPINEIWNTETFYFKAGIYMGVKEENGNGNAQVSFYGLDTGHDDGKGENGWAVGLDAPKVIETTEAVTFSTPIPSGLTVVTTAKLSGDDKANKLEGSELIDTIKGRGGNDYLYGKDGDDNLQGNDGNDVLVGGKGADTLKGGNGADTYYFSHLNQAGDTIVDFKNYHGDKIDVKYIFTKASGFNPEKAIDDGYLSFNQSGDDTQVFVDLDGALGSNDGVLLATLQNYDASKLSLTDFILAQAPMVASYTVSSNGKKISGNSDDNTLVGKDIDETIKGHGGDDEIWGAGGDDYIQGNNGDDVIIGGLGHDEIKGGLGIDTYVYKSIDEAGDDIVEFRAGEKLDISDIADDFIGADGLSIQELIDLDYIKFDFKDKKSVDVYIDMDGDGSSEGDVLLAHLSTLSNQVVDHESFIIDHSTSFDFDDSGLFV